jgi:2-amino-4-hydroxy-6-hydroxymethyldihydropteridine diphosphokinase
MSIVYLGLGTNIGDKKFNLRQAFIEIELSIGTILESSSFYESEPWGFESENQFLNAVIVVDTNFTPLELLEQLKAIERKMGRIEKNKSGYADRIIDIDILFFNNEVIHSPILTIPHKFLHKRDFVLFPLLEITPDFVHPLLESTIEELANRIENKTCKLNDEEL